MKFTPENYKIPDVPMKPFIDDEEIWDYINQTESTPEKVKAIVQKSLDKNRLSLAETAVLLKATDSESIEIIKNGARELEE